ncbi:MAG: DUF4040 domain-containing protein [Candidatus Mcinerneyibacterium aminivorans]|uniref:DUF4040 domain-containing protein n=1 Tax=Candidatus Mcinerneyibacterium aminivorans TaxID=2703815 RepID=A0A5D0MJL4_9BACT|nr:MAG: DUF4040 domain-containing protein [Candidatus Mcinerneyibacterium aminivorans]
MLELYIVLILMIIGAIIAVETKSILSSIVALGKVGLGLTIAFLILKAPDLAIVQLVVEILTLIILIRATLGRDVKYTKENQNWGVKFLSIILIIIFLIFSYNVLQSLPEFGNPILKVADYYIENGMKETGAANLVTSVILDFRAFDTLGEATVLFTAILGALAVLRKNGIKDKDTKENKGVQGD